ncbi:Monocarboxylate transporter 2 [Papilio machaon]|uniref:Monocarboxylate transporter 2 n=1 Tax=Papilio machaon TaxID=76193 RepID=A0A0N0PEB2_PAPMA|nr:Monocarboxylate transporter 2 [Papilio machaon]
MAATAPISEGKETIDEAEEKLLDKSRAVIVANEDGQTTIKSSKKVKLPEDESPAVGAGRFTIGPAPERDWEMVPPDGKWGWFVLVGATLVNILIPGTIKSFGVLLVEFRDVFQASESASSGIVALCYFLYSSLEDEPIEVYKMATHAINENNGIPEEKLLKDTSENNLSQENVHNSQNCMNSTQNLRHNLSKRKLSYTRPISKANYSSASIAQDGFEKRLGSQETFGRRLSTVGPKRNMSTSSFAYVSTHFHGSTLSAFEKPNEFASQFSLKSITESVADVAYCCFCCKRKVKSEPNKFFDVTLLTDPTYLLEPFAEEDPIDLEASHPRLVLTSEDNTPTDKYPNSSPPIFKHKSNLALDDRSPNKLDFARSASAAQVMRLTDDRARKISTSSRHGLSQISSKISNYLPSNPSLLESVPEGKSSRTNSHDTFGRKLTVPKTPKRSPSTSSFQYMSTPFHGSTLSAFEKPSEFASQFSLKSVTDSLAPITYCCGCRKKTDDNIKKEPSKYFDVQLLKDPIYLVILISNCTCAISYTNFIILVPSYAVECGFDKSLGAYLLSIISALDLVGRIGGSAISDVVSTPKRYFFITGLLISGISLAMIPLMKSYLAISVFCSIFGIASGINVGVTALVMTEMLGTERLMSSYGISLFVNGILQLIGPPVCGVWFEYTHSYKSLFVTLGLILCSGAALWGFVPFIHSRRKKAVRMQQNLEEKA